MAVKMCETDKCGAKLEHGVSLMFQRSDKDGKHIIVCGKCAKRMDGKDTESDYKFITGSEVELEEDD